MQYGCAAAARNGARSAKVRRGTVTGVSTALPVLLDTDVGTDVDDAIAIALLLASPELDLRAVTTVSGDARLRGRIAKKLLTLAGHANVPVAAGIEAPVLGQRSFLWLGHEGQGIIAADEQLPLVAAHAVDVLIETVRRDHPHVVAIGPLSNLAVAIRKEPAIVGAIPHLTVMGGTLGRSGATLPVEYNLCSDAEAAQLVLSAGIPTTLVPLDVTSQVALTSAELSVLRGARSRVAKVLAAAMDIWAPLQLAFLDTLPAANRAAVALLHDPLTVAVLIDRSLVATQRLRLRPAIVDGIFSLVAESGAPEFDVVVAVDTRRFVEFLMDRLLRLP